MIELFGLGDREVTRAQVSNWLKQDDHDDYKEMIDIELAIFLNGFIAHHRGKREGVEIVPEKRLNNNIILRKIKIALNLKDNDMLEVFKLVDSPISKHELSAFFRKPGQNQYRLCHDQFLRKFLHGLQLKYRPQQ